MNTKLIRPAVLIATAVAIAVYVIVFAPHDTASPVESRPRRPVPVQREAVPKSVAPRTSGERVIDSAFANALFASRSWYRPPPPAPVVAAIAAPPSVPVAPPLPFQVLGRMQQADGGTVFFLAKDDRVYDVRVGDTIDGTYHLDAYANSQLEFTYLPLHVQQAAVIGEAQ